MEGNIKQLYTKDNQHYGQVKYTKEFFSNYSKHSHDMLSITAIESNSVNIEFNGFKDETLSKDELAIFNPYLVHKSTNKSSDKFGCYVLYLDVDWCKDIQKNIFKENKDFLPINLNILKNKNLYCEFIDICKQILLSKNIEDFSIMVEIFIIKIFKKYCDVNISLDNNEKPNETIKKVKQYILDNIEEQLSLDDIAIFLGYNKYHIIKIFKKQYGLTPHAFIVNHKINKAKKMIIEDNNLTIVDVANEVGFYDQSHFSKSFKKVFATSPSNMKQ